MDIHTFVYKLYAYEHTHANQHTHVCEHTHEMRIPAHMRTSICTYTYTCTSKDEDTQTGTTCTCTIMYFQQKKNILPPKNTCTCSEGVHVQIFGTCTRAKHTNSHAMTCNGHAHMQHARAACHLRICIFILVSFESHSRPVRAHSAKLGTRSRGVLTLRRGGQRRLRLEHAPGRCRQAGALMRNRASETGAGPAATQAGSSRARGDDAADGACQCPLGERGSGEHHACFAPDSTCAPGLSSATTTLCASRLHNPRRPLRKKQRPRVVKPCDDALPDF